MRKSRELPAQPPTPVSGSCPEPATRKSALSGGAGGEPDWPLVAGHYERAQRFDEAASAYQQASSDARRRGALAEARAYLTQALAQLEHGTPGPDRDRRETALRLERGFLTSAAEGYAKPRGCRGLRAVPAAGRDRPARRRASVATLGALAGYYVARADLRRAAQVIKSLRAGLEQGRQWFRAGDRGRVRGAWRGCAASSMPPAPSSKRPPRAGPRQTSARLTRCGSCPPTRSRSRTTHLAFTRLVRGDLTGAEAELAHWRRAGPTSSAFPRARTASPTRASVEIGVRIEAGQLDRAAVLAADLSELAERHGFDGWRLYGATWQASRQRPGRTRRRPRRPGHARGSHRDRDHARSTPCARSG